MTSRRRVHEHTGKNDGGGAPTEHGRVEREEAEGEGGAEHLQRQDGAGDAVVERRYADGLQVDHLIEGFDVESGALALGAVSSAFPARRQS